MNYLNYSRTEPTINESDILLEIGLIRHVINKNKKRANFYLIPFSCFFSLLEFRSIHT